MTITCKRDLEYEKNNRGWCYTNQIEGFKCKNFEICDSILPDWWWSCKTSYICSGCDAAYGTWTSQNTIKTGKGFLNFKDNIDCPICLETKRGVDQPNCNHYLCIQCFRNMYNKEYIESPIFPYPEIEEEYYDNPDDPKWENEYPLLKVYEEENDEYDEKINEICENENLDKCPLCRK